MNTLFSWSLWPQYTYGLMMAVMLLAYTINHGKPIKYKDTYNAGTQALRVGLIAWLLHMGGFW